MKSGVSLYGLECTGSKLEYPMRGGSKLYGFECTGSKLEKDRLIRLVFSILYISLFQLRAMPPGIPVGIEKEKAMTNESWLFQFIRFFTYLYNMSMTKKIILASMYGAFGDPKQEGRRSALMDQQAQGRLLRKITANSAYEPYATSSFMFLEKKPYKNHIVFDEEPPKLTIELKPLNLIEDDKQDKRRNIDGTGVYGEDLRIGTSERDLGIS